MAIVNLVGSRVMDGLDNVPKDLAAPGEAGGRVRCFVETVEVGSADSDTSTYLLARVPSNAVILPTSTLYWDDLASTGAPTVDVGVFNQSGATGITDDDNALADGLDVTSAGSSVMPSGIANYGLPLWDLVASQTTDPGRMLDIKATLQDADVNVGGTITMVLHYSVD